MADYQTKDSEKHAGGAGFDDGMHQTASYGQGTARRASISDAVFGEITEDGPNYRAV